MTPCGQLGMTDFRRANLHCLFPASSSHCSSFEGWMNPTGSLCWSLATSLCHPGDSDVYSPPSSWQKPCSQPPAAPFPTLLFKTSRKQSTFRFSKVECHPHLPPHKNRWSIGREPGGHSAQHHLLSPVLPSWVLWARAAHSDSPPQTGYVKGPLPTSGSS